MSRNIMRAVIPCRCCEGAGFEELPAVHARVYEALTKAQRPMSAPEIARVLNEDVGNTAINNRLEDLRGWRMVSRTRDGKTWMYEARK